MNTIRLIVSILLVIIVLDLLCVIHHTKLAGTIQANGALFRLMKPSFRDRAGADRLNESAKMLKTVENEIANERLFIGVFMI